MSMMDTPFALNHSLPFALSLSKERTTLWTVLSNRSWFDKLTTNGLLMP